MLSGLAVVLWLLTNNPNLAIIFAIISDALAAVPTLTKAWHNPETESAWPFIIGTFSPFTSFLAATTWTFSELAFPSYLIAINAFILFFVVKKSSNSR